MKNTTLCYIEKDGRWLMLYRGKKENDPNAGKWVGIGGKFEDKESPEDCVIREVKEETGLTLLSQRIRGIITFVSDKWETEYMYLFTADRFEGEMTLCDEGDLMWVEREKVFSLPLWAGDRLFLSRITDPNSPFFSMKLSYTGETLSEAWLDGEPFDF